MSEQRPVQTPSGIDVATPASTEDAELYAKISSVLDRGYLNERLNVQLPADRVGQWVRDDPMEIARVTALGGELDDGTYGKAAGLTGDGTGRTKVGDVVLMTFSKRVYDIIERVRLERYNEAHVKQQQEDVELAQNLQSTGLTPISQSKLEKVTKKE